MKDISSNSIDLVLCDLPFGCLGPEKAGGGVPREGTEGAFGGCEWDVKIDLEAFWTEVKRIRRNDHSPCIHFTTTRYGFDLYNSNPKEFRYDLVWTKPTAVGFLLANKMPMRSHEMLYVFSKKGAAYERIDVSGCLKSWIHCSTKKTKGGHPTTKPVELYTLLIERYCPPGGTVLDPTFGSCNSGKAARDLGRNYIGIEKDKGFYDKAKSSME
jgi:site-specific DNA-methyltransferase (adenine-specific)